MNYNFVFDHFLDLLIILTIFTAGAASPGPATLMILNVGLHEGRRAAIALSIGIVCGSMFWACVAATGFATVLVTSAIAFTVIKLLGAGYLLFLAFKSLHSAMVEKPRAIMPQLERRSFQSKFVKGLLLHLTNPKAPLVWMATLSVGVDNSTNPAFLIIVILSCGLMSTLIFIGYAYLFSSARAISAYHELRRPFHLLVGFLFGAAGIKILTLSPPVYVAQYSHGSDCSNRSKGRMFSMLEQQCGIGDHACNCKPENTVARNCRDSRPLRSARISPTFASVIPAGYMQHRLPNLTNNNRSMIEDECRQFIPIELLITLMVPLSLARSR